MIESPRRIARALKNAAVQRAQLGFTPVLQRERAAKIISRIVPGERGKELAKKICDKLGGIKSPKEVAKFFDDLEGKVA